MAVLHPGPDPGERWGNPAGRAVRPVLDGRGRQAPRKTEKVAVSLATAFPVQTGDRGEVNDLTVQELVVAFTRR